MGMPRCSASTMVAGGRGNTSSVSPARWLHPHLSRSRRARRVAWRPAQPVARHTMRIHLYGLHRAATGSKRGSTPRACRGADVSSDGGMIAAEEAG